MRTLALCSKLGLRDRLLNLRIGPQERIRKKLIANGVRPEIANDVIKVMEP